MGLTSFLNVSAKVDWNNDGDFSDSGENVSADLRYPVHTSRGRASSTDEFRAGSAGFRLKNETGEYTPFYSSSSLYPNVLPGRPCQLQVSYNSVTYDLFAGRCSPESGRFSSGGDIDFGALDAFEDFRKGKTKTELLENVRVDEILDQLLDDYGWPAGARDLDTAAQTVGLFMNAGYIEPTLEALQRAAKQELGGGLFISKAGDVRFQNRNHRSATAAIATLTRTFDDLIPSLRQEDLVDEVRGAYARFTIASDPTIVYTLSAQGRAIYPGSDARNRFEGTFNGAGVKDAIEPVGATDYFANAAADGSGTDKTAQLVVDSFAATSGGFVIQFENLDSSTVYLYGDPAFQVRGLPIAASSEDNVVTATVASPIVTGQTLEQEFEHNDDASSVVGWVNYQRSSRGVMQPRLTLQLTPDTDALMAVVLGAELGDRVTLDDTGAAWLTNIAGDYFIEAIDLEIRGPGEATARWSMFPKDLVLGAFFRISGAALSGDDYSTIADASDLVGDRIAF